VEANYNLLFYNLPCLQIKNNKLFWVLV
jgi:hypothetical protein